MLCSIEQRKTKRSMVYCSQIYVADIFSFQFLDDFVYELSMHETNAEKCHKIGNLWDSGRL